MYSKQLHPSVHAAAVLCGQSAPAITVCFMQWEHTENKGTDLACHWLAVCQKTATGGQTGLLTEEGRLPCMPAGALTTTGFFLPAVSIPFCHFVAFAEA